MLIKSECQALDETRHKPAWNLFEQRQSCKMAREICNVVCPLKLAHRPVSVTPITLNNRSRETGRQTWWDPPRPTSSAHPGGDSSLLTLGVNRRDPPPSPSLRCG